MPGFYLVVDGLQVVVRASADGHVTGTAAIPVPPASAGRTWVLGEAFGSGDGRHFVIVMSQAGGPPGVADITLFHLTVSPDGQPGRLGQVTFHSSDEPLTGAALSPDGRMLAVSLLDEFAVADGGDHVLVQAFAFGRIDNGVFTALPATTPRTLPVSAAW